MYLFLLSASVAVGIGQLADSLERPAQYDRNVTVQLFAPGGWLCMAYKNKADKTKYQNDFILRSYDRINLTVPKGRKEEIKAFADSKGMSVNSFINEAIDTAMERGQ